MSGSPDLRATIAAAEASSVNPRRGSGRRPLTEAPPPLGSRLGRGGIRFRVDEPHVAKSCAEGAGSSIARAGVAQVGVGGCRRGQAVVWNGRALRPARRSEPRDVVRQVAGRRTAGQAENRHRPPDRDPAWPHAGTSRAPVAADDRVNGPCACIGGTAHRGGGPVTSWSATWLLSAASPRR